DAWSSDRSGPFWDAAAGRIPLPPAAATLGFELLDADVGAGTIEVAFTAVEEFTTPRGDVLEGFLAAMLHETLGPALLATLSSVQFISTLELKASFLRPVFAGPLFGRGIVVHRDGDIAFVEGALVDRNGEVVATGAATIRVIDFEPRPDLRPTDVEGR